jgi:hypothetical protein
MDPRVPNEDEKKSLTEIYRFHRTSEIYMLFMLYPTLLLISLTYFLDKYPILVFSIIMLAVVMLSGIIYLVIKRELVRRCPRCRLRGTPPTPLPPKPGSCPRCGMYLDPSYKEEPKETLGILDKWLE